MRNLNRKLVFRKAEINGTRVLYPWPAISIGLWLPKKYFSGRYFSWVLHLRLSWLMWEIILIGEKLKGDE